MGMTPHDDDHELTELLGAYALHACDAEETAAIEALLARDPELAREARRLTGAAAWIGATEALAAPAGLEETLVARARARRSPVADVALRAYTASVARLEDTLATLVAEDHAEPTANGLDARDLIVHLAAQESSLAQSLGRSPVPQIVDVDVDARTARFVEHFDGRSIDEVRETWKQSVDEVTSWASEPESREIPVHWLEMDWPRDHALIVRAFENWIHRDDLREATGRVAEPPPAADIHAMADFSMRTLPMCLETIGRAHEGKHARVVLTGAGGGEWIVPMGNGRPDPDAAPDIVFTADVVDWCKLVGERVTPAALARSVEGDRALADDLIAAAPTFAML
jgi:uncharacterized protein (TIGR03083 family)